MAKSLLGDDLGGNDLCGNDPSRESNTAKSATEARVMRPDRRRPLLRPQILDQLIPANHRARGVVKFVEDLQLTAFFQSPPSRGIDPRRPVTDPAMLLTLWLLATSEGVGSARQLERLCERDDAYRWICGGVLVNRHGLRDFRIGHGAALDDLMTKVLGVLLHQGIVTLRRIVQGGVRLPAGAEAESLCRAQELPEQGLQGWLGVAARQVMHTKRLIDTDDPTHPDSNARESTARAIREREQRVQQALHELRALEPRMATTADNGAITSCAPR